MDRDLMGLVEDLMETNMLYQRKGPIAKRVGLEKHFDEPLGKGCIVWARGYLSFWASRYLVTECQRLAIKALSNTTKEQLSIGQKEQVIVIFCEIFNKLYPLRKRKKEEKE